MKEIIRLWKNRDFKTVYEILKINKYDYTIDNLDKDFSKISSVDKFCYLIYLLSIDCSAKNTLLLCDFLMYTDTFFYDIHPVIRMFICRTLELYPNDESLLNWIISVYEKHPDSPFEESEIQIFKNRLL